MRYFIININSTFFYERAGSTFKAVCKAIAESEIIDEDAIDTDLSIECKEVDFEEWKAEQEDAW